MWKSKIRSGRLKGGMITPPTPDPSEFNINMTEKEEEQYFADDRKVMPYWWMDKKINKRRWIKSYDLNRYGKEERKFLEQTVKSFTKSLHAPEWEGVDHTSIVKTKTVVHHSKLLQTEGMSSKQELTPEYLTMYIETWDAGFQFTVFLLCGTFKAVEAFECAKNMTIQPERALPYITAFFLTRIISSLLLGHMLLCMGVYHKRGAFNLGAMLPISAAFPYFLTLQYFAELALRLNKYTIFFYVNFDMILSKIFWTIPHFCEDIPYQCVPPGMDLSDCELISHKKDFLQAEIGYLDCQGDLYSFPVTNCIRVTFASYVLKTLHLFVFALIVVLLTGLTYVDIKSHIQVAGAVNSVSILFYVIFVILSYDADAWEKLVKSNFNWTFDGDAILFGIIDGLPRLSTFLSNIFAATARLPLCTTPSWYAVVLTGYDTFAMGLVVMMSLIVTANVASSHNTDLPTVTELAFEFPVIGLEYQFDTLLVLGMMWNIIWFLSTATILITFEVVSLDSILLNFTSQMGRPIYFRRIFLFSIMSVIFVLVSITLFLHIDTNTFWALEFLNVPAILIFFVIFHLYTLQRFSRDMEFMLGSPPAAMFDNVSIVYPLILIGIICWTLFTEHKLITIVELSAVGIVVGLILVTEIIRFASNFEARLVPQAYFGPPNTNLRRKRKKFKKEEDM